MVMVTGDEPVHGVHLLRNKLSTPMQSTAADISQVELRDVYGAVGYHPLDHQRIAGLVSSGAIFREVPFGEVKVDFDAYFAALQENGYGGSDHRSGSGGCARGDIECAVPSSANTGNGRRPCEISGIETAYWKTGKSRV